MGCQALQAEQLQAPRLPILQHSTTPTVLVSTQLLADHITTHMAMIFWVFMTLQIRRGWRGNRAAFGKALSSPSPLK
jgi:hypothetical protein